MQIIVEQAGMKVTIDGDPDTVRESLMMTESLGKITEWIAAKSAAEAAESQEATP